MINPVTFQEPFSFLWETLSAHPPNISNKISIFEAHHPPTNSTPSTWQPPQRVIFDFCREGWMGEVERVFWVLVIGYPFQLRGTETILKSESAFKMGLIIILLDSLHVSVSVEHHKVFVYVWHMWLQVEGCWKMRPQYLGVSITSNGLL